MKSIMRRAAVIAVLMAAPAFLVVAGTGDVRQPATPTSRTTAVTLVGDGNRGGRIHEEDARWNCHTMGNQRCGDPVASWVGPTELRGAVHACGWTIKGRPPVPPSLMRACLGLGVLKAQTVKDPDGSSYTLAPGSARVYECRTQYVGAELKACLNQPRYA